MIDDVLAEEGDGRWWNDHRPQWVNKEGKNDGFMSTLTRMVSILPEGKALWGGPCQKVQVEEVDVRACGAKGSENNDPEDPDAWEAEISMTGKEGVYVFPDGSLLAGGNVGIWGVATVWDGEVAGMVGGLARTHRERKFQILADSKEAITAVRKAGRTGKARLSHLKKVVDDIKHEARGW